MITKRCTGCGIDKPAGEFAQDRKRRDGRQRLCRACKRDYDKNRHLAELYGITIADFQELLERQNRRCAVCRDEFTDARPKIPCVDHDHGTGVVRGLLCMNCNFAIGHLNDSIALCHRAAEYLERAEFGVSAS